MKEEVEVISNPYSVSFVCSFGYSIAHVEKDKNRLNDEYTFRNWDTFEMMTCKRKDFFKEMLNRHGGIKIGERDLNACKDHDLFCEISIDGVSKWTKSRMYRDMMDCY